ncbi:MAG TPA: low-specificity L-threonine aldolase [Anaerolineales bacterium]|nr:low-specificity L-threonine aldolase [Anaerolineales bacterium]
MRIVDLRSDTVTQPTPAMREAMARAEVGDDVFGDDPTVNRLQTMAAERLGKEAALFVPSGTMGNLAAVLSHCGRGDEAILGDQCHTFMYEAGGIAALGGVHPRTVLTNPDGTLPLRGIEEAIRTDDVHFPITRLICLENTHNRCGGVALTAEYTRRVGALARDHGLRLHLDGARIFNAAAATGVEAKELAAAADSVMFCLSKGLAAPVGSMLVGSGEFIQRARRMRKQLGGGMRQVGVIAAAGIVALETMTQRLAEDHRRARRLAEGLRSIPGVALETDAPATNMVYFSLAAEAPLDGAGMEKAMAADAIWIHAVGPRRIRLVTHNDIDDEGVERAIDAVRKAVVSGEG